MILLASKLPFLIVQIVLINLPIEKQIGCRSVVCKTLRPILSPLRRGMMSANFTLSVLPLESMTILKIIGGGSQYCTIKLSFTVFLGGRQNSTVCKGAQ